MMIQFWSGFFLLIGISILVLIIMVWITKKMNKNTSLAGIFGFFIGVGIVLTMLIIAKRLYVVNGNEDCSDFLVYGVNEYKMKNGTKVDVNIPSGSCMVINDWDQPVIIEEAVYGGYGFSGYTEWVKPEEVKFFEEKKIFYFYDDTPPNEISTKSDDEKIRLWLRNKR